MPGVLGISRRPTPREWRRAGFTFVGGLVVILLAIFLVHPQPGLLPSGTAAPPLVLDTDAGSRLDVLKSASQKPVTVEFFEATCGDCQQDATAVCRLAAGFSDVMVVAVGAGNEAAATLQAFAARYMAAPCPVILLVDPLQRASHDYQVSVVPTVYVVDKNGKIAYGGVGATGIQGVAGALRALHA